MFINIFFYPDWNFVRWIIYVCLKILRNLKMCWAIFIFWLSSILKKNLPFSKINNLLRDFVCSFEKLKNNYFKNGEVISKSRVMFMYFFFFNLNLNSRPKHYTDIFLDRLKRLEKINARFVLINHDRINQVSSLFFIAVWSYIFILFERFFFWLN